MGARPSLFLLAFTATSSIRWSMVWEEMGRQGKGTEKKCKGFAPYATTKIFDICGGGAGRLMRGRGGFGLATYKKGTVINEV